jgi:hypothetical protein
MHTRNGPKLFQLKLQVQQPSSIFSIFSITGLSSIHSLDVAVKSNGIHHKFSAPYHPATNGQAERFVQIMKQSLRIMANEPSDVPLKLSRFLMQYRITPHTTTKRSPSKIMFGRNIRSRLDIMRSKLQQDRNSDNYTPKMKATPIFSVGQPVVLKQTDPLHYTGLVDGKEHIRHIGLM